MLQLRVQHHKIFIDNASSSELVLLKKFAKVFIPNYIPDPPYTVVNLYEKDDRSIPTGLLDSLKKKLTKEGVKYSVKDERVYPRPHLGFTIKDKERHAPRENQIEAMAEISKHNFGIVSSATGSGKSWLIEETIAKLKVKTLVIVPSIPLQTKGYQGFVKLFGQKFISYKAPKRDDDELVKTAPKDEEKEEDVFGDFYGKTENSLKVSKAHAEIDEIYGVNMSPEQKYLKNKGVFDKGKKKSWKFNSWQEKPKAKKSFFKKMKSADITVICFQSLPSVSIEFLQSIECVIIDECHHASAETIRDALLHMKSAAYRYAFSATPWRDKDYDQKLLKSALGEKVIYDLSGAEAVEREIITKPEYIRITPPKPNEFLREITNWRLLVEKGIIGNVTRNKCIVERIIDLLANEHNVFVCVDEIAHLEILKERLKEKGIEAIGIHGQQNKVMNQTYIDAVGKKKGAFVSIGTMAVGEGVDMPEISAVVLAGYGKSSIRVLQRIGRGTRKVEGKERLLVYDFEDYFNPILMRHSNERYKAFKEYYEPEGFI